MNRIIIVGNGFDLAHGLKTGYKDFINWYWEQKVELMKTTTDYKIEDRLTTLKTKDHTQWDYFAFSNGNYLFATPQNVLEEVLDKHNGWVDVEKTPFFERITQTIENKGWVDIENEYYHLLADQNEYSAYYGQPEKLNEELNFIKGLLCEYLKKIQNGWTERTSKKELIERIVLEPIKYNDIAVSANSKWKDFKKARTEKEPYEWNRLLGNYPSCSQHDKLTEHSFQYDKVQRLQSYLLEDELGDTKGLEFFTLPEHILLLNFNYTNISDSYLPPKNIFTVNHIHGKLENSENMIFGYGDELDKNYQELTNKNENAYLANIKSIQYLESENYRKLLQFIESDSYQIYIMGHSCGLSDRTLLNTLFEHQNCVSIKAFYYVNKGKDNYTDIVQNISRNFTDMKLMRDRVVNKTYCEPFSINE